MKCWYGNRLLHLLIVLKRSVGDKENKKQYVLTGICATSSRINYRNCYRIISHCSLILVVNSPEMRSRGSGS